MVKGPISELLVHHTKDGEEGWKTKVTMANFKFFKFPARNKAEEMDLLIILVLLLSTPPPLPLPPFPPLMPHMMDS
jgi:hypothetical protein